MLYIIIIIIIIIIIDNLVIVITWRIRCQYMGNLKTITLFNIAKPHDSKVYLFVV